MNGAATFDESLAAARAAVAGSGAALVRALAQVTGASGEDLVRTLGDRFGYPVLSMAQLQALTPLFEPIAYTECAQRGVVAASDAAGATWLVLGDPFDGATEDWALRRLAAVGMQPQIGIAHPDDLLALFTQAERQLRAIDGLGSTAASGGDEEVAAVISLASISDDTSPVVKLVHSTIYDALKLLAGTGESLSGRLLLLDCLRMEWRSVGLTRDPECKVCGRN